MTLRKSFVASTALILCVSIAYARQETSRSVSANAQFVSWYGGLPAARESYHFVPRDDSQVLYEQSASSGFSTYAISSYGISGSAACSGCFNPRAADDFVIPGTGQYYKITAVYAPGVILSGTEPSWIDVTFYDVLKYSKETGKTTIVPKATCDTKSYSDTSGRGDFMVDVSSCKLGRFKSAHDYSVSVQPWFWSNGSWAWQTNRNQIKRQAFFLANSGTGPCTWYYRPVKTCFPGDGYGPDLAFAIYGRQL